MRKAQKGKANVVESRRKYARFGPLHPRQQQHHLVLCALLDPSQPTFCWSPSTDLQTPELAETVPFKLRRSHAARSVGGVVGEKGRVGSALTSSLIPLHDSYRSRTGYVGGGP